MHKTLIYFIRTILAISVLIIPLASFAQDPGDEQAPEKKNKVLIFNFITTGDTEKFDYYSYIIPQTVSKNLINSGKYLVQRIQEKFPRPDDARPLSQQIQEIGKNYAADFIITGTVDVTNKKLDVDLKVYNVKGGNDSTFHTSSNETGAMLKDSIEELYAGSENKIQEFIKENKERYDEGSFSRFYGSLQGLSFGMEGGYFFVSGTWHKRINNSIMAGSFINYQFIPFLGVSAHIDYIASDYNNVLYNYSTLFSQWAPSLNVVFCVPFTNNLYLSFSLGGGYAFTKILYKNLYNTSPFSTTSDRTFTSDPMLNTEISLNLTYSSLLIKIGSSYKYAFILGDRYQIVTVFAGIGYKL